MHRGEQHSDLDLRGDNIADDDGNGSFQRIDSTRLAVKPRASGQRRQQYTAPQRGGVGRGPSDPAAGGEMGSKGKIQTGSSFNKRFNRLNVARYTTSDRGSKAGGPQRTQREFSVKVQSDWLELETLDFAKVRVPSRPRAGYDFKHSVFHLHYHGENLLDSNEPRRKIARPPPPCFTTPRILSSQFFLPSPRPPAQRALCPGSFCSQGS
jgi:hypothetical protein